MKVTIWTGNIISDSDYLSMTKERFLYGWLFGLFKVVSIQYWISILKHRKAEQIIAIYFHQISREKLIRIIKWVLRNNFTFVSEDDIIEFLDGRRVIKGGIFLSFDDGFKSNLELVPVLDNYKIPATFFLSTDAILNKGYFWSLAYKNQKGHRINNAFHKLSYSEKMEVISSYLNPPEPRSSSRPLTREDLINLGKNPRVSFGLHTHHHLSLINCTDKEIEIELNQNIEAVRGIYSKQIKSFAYPHGLSDRNHSEVFRKSKIQIAMEGSNKSISKSSDRYLLPRYGYGEVSMLENYCKFLDCWRK